MRLINSLVDRLLHEPRSFHRANVVAQRTGTDRDGWIGWGAEASGLADIVDLLIHNTRASARNKAKFTKVAARPMDKAADTPNTGGAPSEGQRPAAAPVRSSGTISLKHGVAALGSEDPLMGAMLDIRAQQSHQDEQAKRDALESRRG